MKSLADYPDVLRPMEVKEILRIGRNKVYQLLDNGKIPCVCEGHLYLIQKKALLQYLDGMGNNSINH